MSEDLRERWLNRIEKYYRDTYPKPMRVKVYEILPKDQERLRVLFDVCIRDPDAWKRSVKVPDVAAVERALVEVREAYPELNPHSYNRQIDRESSQITDDAGFDYSRDVENLMDRVMATVRERNQGINGSGEA